MRMLDCEQFLAKYRLDACSIIETLDIGAVRRLCERIVEAKEGDKTLYVFGNGGSAATASHFTADLLKGASYPYVDRIRIISLNDNVPTMTAYANDVAYYDVFLEPLKNFLRPGDLVVGISGSGNSENVLRAIAYANSAEARTFGVVGCGGGKLAKLAMEAIVVDSFDMQHVEDVHLMICHMVSRVLERTNQKAPTVE